MKLVDFHTHQIETSNRDERCTVVSLSEFEICGYEKIRYNYSVGIHPWWIEQDNLDETWKYVLILGNNPSCLAIGETGLDRLRSKSHFHLQLDWCLRHLEYSDKIHKPIMMHLVRSSADWLHLLKNNKTNIPHIIHDTQLGQKEIEQICSLHEMTYFSFSPRLFKNRKKISKCFLLEVYPRLLLESDDFSSHELEELYQECSRILEIGVEDLIQNQQEKFKLIFKI